MVEVKSIPQEAAPARAGRREWVGLAALTVPMMFVLLDNGIIFLALPHLTESLGASSTEALWIADIYGFFLMGFLVTMGRIGDRIGHRKLVLIGAAAFSVLSVVAAFSNSALMLIVMRALLGVAGGIIGPCFFAIIRQMFPDRKQMATAMSIFATAAMVGVSLGPRFGWLVPTVAIIVAGLVFGVVFVVRQRRVASPLLDMNLFGIGAIGATLTMYVLVGIVQSGNGLVLN